MIIRINGKIKKYYVETLAMMFFPGVRFPENESDNTDGLICTVVSERGDDNTLTASVELVSGERKETGLSRVSLDEYDSETAEKIAAGDSFLKAGEKLTGIRPPWGVLTGVRPAKIATDLLEKGYDVKEAADAISRTYLTLGPKAELASKVALAERKLITDQTREECSVYIGIPFCPTRCAYCSFVSYTSKKLLSLIPEYLEVLCSDISDLFKLIGDLGKNVASIYIGGGTPTVLDPHQLEKLLSRISLSAKSSGVCKNIREFTMEAGRPDTITGEKLKIASEYGVSRISVNPQTLNDDVLKIIGRAHSVDDFYRAYETASKSGINDINIDLIAGLPGDSEESFRNTVDSVVSLAPTNITVHTFSVKKSSVFRMEERYDALSPLAGKCIEYSQQKLQCSGYEPYYMYRQKNTVGNHENVGYSIPGHEGLYNVYMMEEVHSIFSAGASSVTKFVSLPDEEGNVRIERFFQPKYPYEYLEEHKETGSRTEKLRKEALAFFS